MKKLLTHNIFALIVLCFILSTAHAQFTPLETDAAFSFHTNVVDANTLRVQWKIHPQYHLYKRSIAFSISDPQTAMLGTITLPKGITTLDNTQGEYTAYRNDLSIPVPVLAQGAGNAELIVHYQGCSDLGTCYPPQSRTINLTFDSDKRLVHAMIAPAASSAQKNDLSRASQLLATHNYPLIILGFFVFGLLLSFTPCVLPMVPILSGIILGHGESLSIRKSFTLSLTYVLAMSLTYACLGMIISTLGENLQSALQQPWILSLTSALFFVLSLSMFGLYELKMPQRFEAMLANIAYHQRGGHYVGVAVMGILATLILSPCVTAPLVGVLTYIAMNGDAQLGFIALFFLGLGMGAPLLLVGLSARTLLPKAGYWMNSVKIVLGLLLLAVAISVANRLLSGPLGLLLWAGLVITSAYYLYSQAREKSHPLSKLAQGFALFIALYGVIMVIGAATQNDDPFAPLAHFTSDHHPTSQLERVHVSTLAQTQTAISEATANNKPAILMFSARWCTSCQIIERTTLRDPDILALLADRTLIEVDLTQSNPDTDRIKQAFGVVAPPTFLFFDAQGERLKQDDHAGELSAKQLIAILLQEKAT